MGPAMTSNTKESGVQTTTVHAVATRTAAFKTVQCNELNVTALYILITKQINKAYKTSVHSPTPVSLSFSLSYASYR